MKYLRLLGIIVLLAMAFVLWVGFSPRLAHQPSQANIESALKLHFYLLSKAECDKALIDNIVIRGMSRKEHAPKMREIIGRDGYWAVKVEYDVVLPENPGCGRDDPVELTQRSTLFIDRWIVFQENGRLLTSKEGGF